jgi:hypothetical protein
MKNSAVEGTSGRENYTIYIPSVKAIITNTNGLVEPRFPKLIVDLSTFSRTTTNNADE